MGGPQPAPRGRRAGAMVTPIDTGFMQGGTPTSVPLSRTAPSRQPVFLELHLEVGCLAASRYPPDCGGLSARVKVCAPLPSALMIPLPPAVQVPMISPSTGVPTP